MSRPSVSARALVTTAVAASLSFAASIAHAEVCRDRFAEWGVTNYLFLHRQDYEASPRSALRKGATATGPVTVTFRAMGERFTLELVPDHSFIGPGCVIEEAGAARPCDLYVYRGRAVGRRNGVGTALIAIVDGVLTGRITLETEEYGLEYPTFFLAQPARGQSFIYRLSDVLQEPGCEPGR